MRVGLLEVGAFHEPSGPPQGPGLRQPSGAFGGGRTIKSARGLAQSKTLSRQATVHGPNARPILEVEGLHEPEPKNVQNFVSYETKFRTRRFLAQRRV